ncbi:MAG: fatty acid desaturase [Pirellulales bacterium]
MAQSAIPQPNFDVDLSDGTFSLSQARTIVGEFFAPKAWIYWTDFLLSWTVGIACFAIFEMADKVVVHQFQLSPVWCWPVWIATFLVSSFLFYRCALFIHELMHLRSNRFRAFRFVWNILCGIPFLVPSFVYYTHIDHHRRKFYGTTLDGEYISLASKPAWQILLYLSQCVVIPLVTVLRFGLLTPLTWVSPRVRTWVHRHASSMIMDPTYIRPLPTQRVLLIMRIQEIFCLLWIVFVAIRFFSPMGILPGTLTLGTLLHAYAMGIFILFINAMRTLGAHRWIGNGEEMTFVQQLLDSVNYPDRPLTGGLWAPVGLRYHALHHIFPTMPYHALATAHRRLMRDLPVDSPYRKTEASSLNSVLQLLWNRARATGLNNQAASAT